MKNTIKSISELEDVLSAPSDRLLNDMEKIHGNIIILGAGGKMGPSLAKLANRALKKLGKKNEVIAVSRFSSRAAREDLEKNGIKVIAADLLNEEELKNLPEAENVIYMAGQKFGTQGNEPFTWAMNAYLPGLVGAKYQGSKIVVFSTGNVYPFMPADSGGATEEVPPEPVGEYAQSCLGRERIFEYFSARYKTPVFMYRLNYAIDLRYGVLYEIGKAVYENQPVDLTMGYVNVIWQGDANEYALRALRYCQSPPKLMNITGTDTLKVQELALRFGELFGKNPVFENEPEPTALLSNAGEMARTFGEPQISPDQMIYWVAEWIKKGGPSLNKPTHFQERKGKF